MGLTPYPEVAAARERAEARLKEYCAAIQKMFDGGVAPAPDWPGWSDRDFHGLLARRLHYWQEQFEIARIKGIKYDGIGEFFVKIGKELNHAG